MPIVPRGARARIVGPREYGSDKEDIRRESGVRQSAEAAMSISRCMSIETPATCPDGLHADALADYVFDTSALNVPVFVHVEIRRICSVSIVLGFKSTLAVSHK
jgi:hypothetical protein